MFSSVLFQKQAKKSHNKGRRFSLPTLNPLTADLPTLSPVPETTISPLQRDITLEEELQARHLKVAQDVDCWVKKWRHQQEEAVTLRRQMATREAEHQSRFETMSKSYKSQIEDLQSDMGRAAQSVEKITQEKAVLRTDYKDLSKKSAREKNRLTSQIEEVTKELYGSRQCNLELEKRLKCEREERAVMCAERESLVSELEKYKIETQSTISKCQQNTDQSEMWIEYYGLLLDAAVNKLKYLEKNSSSHSRPTTEVEVNSPSFSRSRSTPQTDVHSHCTLTRSCSADVLQDIMVSSSGKCFDSQSMASVGFMESEANWHMSNGFRSSLVPSTLTEASEDGISMTSTTVEPDETSVSDIQNSVTDIKNNVSDIHNSVSDIHTSASDICSSALNGRVAASVIQRSVSDISDHDRWSSVISTDAVPVVLAYHIDKRHPFNKSFTTEDPRINPKIIMRTNTQVGDESDAETRRFRTASAISDTVSYSEGATHQRTRTGYSNLAPISRRRGGVDHQDHADLLRIEEITKNMKTNKTFGLNLFKKLKIVR